MDNKKIYYEYDFSTESAVGIEYEKYLDTQNQCYWKNFVCDRARSNCDQNENFFGEGTLHRLKTSSEMESAT